MKKVIEIPDAVLKLSEQLRTQPTFGTGKPLMFRIKDGKHLVDSVYFLTKKEADKHLESNSYHYGKRAFVYVDDIWRSPEFEALLSFVESLTEQKNIETNEEGITVDRTAENNETDAEVVVTFPDGYKVRFWATGETNDTYIDRAKLAKELKHCG